MSTPAAKPAAKPTNPPTKSPLPTPPKPAAAISSATGSGTPPPATHDSEPCNKTVKRILIAGGIAVAAIAIPIVSALLCKADQHDDPVPEEPKKTASAASSVLDKLVSWVKDIQNSAPDDLEKNVDKVDDVLGVKTEYAEIASVVDFAKTQSL